MCLNGITYCIFDSVVDSYDCYIDYLKIINTTTFKNWLEYTRKMKQN